jgi:hypothetical protein
MLLAYFFFGARRPHPSVDRRIFAQITNDMSAGFFPSLSAGGKTVMYASKASGNGYLSSTGGLRRISI